MNKIFLKRIKRKDTLRLKKRPLEVKNYDSCNKNSVEGQKNTDEAIF